MIDPESYLDDANKNLWNTMNQHFNIRLDYSKEGCYANFHKNNDCTIFVVKGKPDPASFTHELLHLYLPLHNTYIGGCMKNKFGNTPPFNNIFNDCLCEHISNSLEHIKMLPIYLKMGYPINKFLQKYYDKKLTTCESVCICLNYKKLFSKTHLRIISVRFFIGKFFAAKADPNMSFNYEQQLNTLDKLDHQLFSALNNFWNSWLEYDVELRQNDVLNDYIDLLDTFKEDLSNWCKNKEFV